MGSCITWNLVHMSVIGSSDNKNMYINKQKCLNVKFQQLDRNNVVWHKLISFNIFSSHVCTGSASYGHPATESC